jgi:hypothetical protein
MLMKRVGGGAACCAGCVWMSPSELTQGPNNIAHHHTQANVTSCNPTSLYICTLPLGEACLPQGLWRMCPAPIQLAGVGYEGVDDGGKFFSLRLYSVRLQF